MTPIYKSLKDHVYEFLSDQITQGSLKPNQKIDVFEISRGLQLSTTPVREALAQLENEGYIERLPRRGYKVRELTVQKVKELYQILGCLEGLASSLARSRITESDLMELEKTSGKIDDAIKEHRFQDYYGLQLEFHERINSLCCNEELSQLIAFVKKRFMKRVYSLYDNEKTLCDELIRSNDDHKKITKLLREGDGEEIERFIRNVHWNVDLAKFSADRE